MPGRWCAVINTTLCLGAATAATTPTTATSTTLASALLVALPFSVSGRGIRPHRGSMPTLLLPVTFPVCPASRTLLSLHLLHFLMEQLQRTLGAHTDLDLAITVACTSEYVRGCGGCIGNGPAPLSAHAPARSSSRRAPHTQSSLRSSSSLPYVRRVTSTSALAHSHRACMALTKQNTTYPAERNKFCCRTRTDPSRR